MPPFGVLNVWVLHRTETKSTVKSKSRAICRRNGTAVLKSFLRTKTSPGTEYLVFGGCGTVACSFGAAGQLLAVATTCVRWWKARRWSSDVAGPGFRHIRRSLVGDMYPGRRFSHPHKGFPRVFGAVWNWFCGVRSFFSWNLVQT